MVRARYRANVCFVGQRKYLVMGGTNQKSKAERSCEVYLDSADTEPGATNQSVADMKYKRSRLSSCWMQRMNRVVVAGGMIYGKGSTQIELFDVQRNEWTLHGAQFQFEHKYPAVWADEDNPNVCYVAGDWIGFGGRKDSLGFVEWIDLRENQKKWNLFDDHTLTEMFGIDGVRANLWESRTLTLL